MSLLTSRQRWVIRVCRRLLPRPAPQMHQHALSLQRLLQLRSLLSWRLVMSVMGVCQLLISTNAKIRALSRQTLPPSQAPTALEAFRALLASNLAKPTILASLLRIAGCRHSSRRRTPVLVRRCPKNTTRTPRKTPPRRRTNPRQQTRNQK